MTRKKQTERERLVNDFYREKLRGVSDKKGVARLLSISYYTLMGKINEFGDFTESQLEILKEYFREKEEKVGN